MDEFQDTNFAQLQLIKELAGDHLCVVGDDDQTIYRFRGAYLTNIRDFREMGRRHCTKSCWTENYRNPPADACACAPAHGAAPTGSEKELTTEKPAGGAGHGRGVRQRGGGGGVRGGEIERLVGTTVLLAGGWQRTLADLPGLCDPLPAEEDGAKFHESPRRSTGSRRVPGDVDFLRRRSSGTWSRTSRSVDNPLVAGLRSTGS